MSNRVDFFQSDQKQLVIPAAGVSVFLEGSLCPYLELLEIVRGEWPEFSWARLAFNAAAYPEADKSLEEIEAELSTGKKICIRQFYNKSTPGSSVYSIPIFIGQIEGVEARLGKKGESFEIVAKDFSARLDRVTVYGQRVSDNNTNIFLAGVDTIFNEDGKANAATELIEKNGNSYTVFSDKPSLVKFWGYAEAIRYLLCEYLAGGDLQIPDIAQLQTLTDNQQARDLDVTGLSLLEALHHCCQRVGLKFRFVRRLVETGPAEAIEFYKIGSGRTIELNHQQRGEQVSLSNTNILALHSKKDFWPVTHRYIGQGDFKVFEATFDLAQAWDAADEDTNYYKFSPSTNPDFYQVKNVYRKWCLNEAGDYSGAAFDFSNIFGNSNFSHRRRRFLPALTTDKGNKSLGYFLQVSFNGGFNWWQYLYAFNNLQDECGIWLSSDQLDIDTWIAALKGVLKFKITASVVSDERINCDVSDGPVNSVVPVVEKVITLPRQFKYRKVSGQSTFANSSDESMGIANEVDDSAVLYEFTRKKAQQESETIETVDIQTPYLAFDCRIGDIVTCSPESRDLLGYRSDNRSVRWIKRVHMDFKNQCTNLKIVRQRKF
ncbi:MAG: hypothetical protein FVQ80_01305 [Planctomycetes bacterium]|nr:hypothetical protein [Planctomycetota bacterium]